MQRQVIIMRHAKAAAQPEGSDFDRPLTQRGLSDAANLAQWLSQQPLALDAVYVSSAARTLQTWQQLAQGWKQAEPLQAQLLDTLYLASAGDLLDMLQRLPDAQQNIALIGHNPGLHQLALLLCQPQRSSTAYERMELSFSTCSCAWLTLELLHWRDVAPYSAQLKQLWQTSHALD